MNASVLPPELEFSYPFEHSFDVSEYANSLRRHWKFSIYISIAYIVLTTIGRRMMKSRKPFDLTALLFLWNSSLAIFSLAIAIRYSVFGKYLLFTQGFEGVVCYCRFCDEHPVQAFWRYWFAMSKLIELGDTAFVILRKQPLLFLHRYHHVSVLVFAWFSFSDNTSTSNLFGFVNSMVHTLMYSYFALRSIKVRMPAWIRMTVTGTQISQMVFGCYANYTAFTALSQGRHCEVSFANLNFAFWLYISYLLLFTNFFVDSYVKGVSLSSYWQNTREQVKKES